MMPGVHPMGAVTLPRSPRRAHPQARSALSRTTSPFRETTAGSMPAPQHSSQVGITGCQVKKPTPRPTNQERAKGSLRNMPQFLQSQNTLFPPAYLAARAKRTQPASPPSMQATSGRARRATTRSEARSTPNLALRIRLLVLSAGSFKTRTATTSRLDSKTLVNPGCPQCLDILSGRARRATTRSEARSTPNLALRVRLLILSAGSFKTRTATTSRLDSKLPTIPDLPQRLDTPWC